MKLEVKLPAAGKMAAASFLVVRAVSPSPLFGSTWTTFKILFTSFLVLKPANLKPNEMEMSQISPNEVKSSFSGLKNASQGFQVAN